MCVGGFVGVQSPFGLLTTDTNVDYGRRRQFRHRDRYGQSQRREFKLWFVFSGRHV